jgi:histidinol-phosphatase
MRLAVSRTRALAQAKVAIWPAVPDLPAPLRESGARLAAVTMGPLVESHAAGGVKHGALLVASGLLDGFMFVGAGPWDLAAMVPVVEEAGGRFTDVLGDRSLHTPAALFSNGVLHDEILSRINWDR